jgi:predicted RND superfamily exporter protein
VSEEPSQPDRPSGVSRWERWADVQYTRPYLFLLAAVAIVGASIPLLTKLELNSDFTAMLPESAASVRDLDEIRERFGGTATLTLAVQSQSGSIEPVHAFARGLVPRIEAMSDLLVTSVDWNVGDFESFVEERRFLYADREDLVEIRDALRDRLDWERSRANPFFIDLGDQAPPDPEAVIDRIRRDAEEAREAMDRFPGGFYQHPTEPLVLLFVRTGIRGGETRATDRLIAAIEREANAIAGAAATSERTRGAVAWQAGDLRIDYGGDIMDVREENDALQEAVEKSTLFTLALLFVVIYAFFLRVRAVPMLALTLVAPCCATFAIAEPIVDYLNASSAFLGSIVVGNGVNASIMWLGRYFEERRAGHDVRASLRITHLGTWSGTFAATIAAALAYGSLMVTDYRGFRDFGFIGSLGMSLSWLAAYGILPALVVIGERWRPMEVRDSERRMKGIYGVLFARLALGDAEAAADPARRARRPRIVLAVCAVLTLVSTIAVVLAALGDPLEYDFRNLQAQRSEESRVQWVNDRVGDTVEETRSGSALAILAPRREDVAHLREQLTAFGREHPDVIGAVRTIEDLMPADQEAKVPLVRELRALLLEVRPYLSDARQADIDAHTPPETITVVRPEDLPASVARPFIERDGTRGRLVFVEHAEGRDTWDGRYMMEWSAAVRSARTEEGRSPAVAGAAVVFADLLGTIFGDSPKALGASFVATFLLLLFTFRGHGERALSMLSMLAGVTWMTGMLALTGTKLNFLNMVAFPITFGIGVEYGVNFVKRYLEEKENGESDGPGAVRAALEGAGGAVILCSLTTLIGYISLYTSTSRAMNGFGLAMSLGELTCLLSSVVALPAAMYLLEIRREPRSTAASR